MNVPPGGNSRARRGIAPVCTALPDGHYRVTTPYLCASFVVKDGKVDPEWCAPVLRRHLPYWMMVAVSGRVGSATVEWLGP